MQSFADVLTAGGDSNIVLGLIHSVIITVGSIVGMVVIGSLAAYVLARSTARWGNIAFYLFLIAIILPTQLGLHPALHRRPAARPRRLAVGDDHPLHRHADAARRLPVRQLLPWPAA